MKDTFDREILRQLADKWKRGELSDAEQQQLMDWDISHLDELLVLPDHSGGPEVVKQRMLDHILNGMEGSKSGSMKLWPRIAVVAAAVAAIVFGVWFMTSESGALKQVQGEVVVNDIAPGKNTATLTLANGKKIILSDALKGELAEEAGVKITKTEDGQIIYDLSSGATGKDLDPSELGMTNTLSTARGETYEVILPDKSHVWLNAASSITYPASFAGLRERKVSLEGEAYFEVFKNKVQAFVVSTKKQDVTVMGTHFNINSYVEEASTRTTLLEGIVKVSTSDDETILNPNQQAILTADNVIKVKNVVAEEAIAWKNGLFNYKNTPVSEVMRQIARWYDVSIVYDSPALKERLLTGSVSRYENVSGILHAIELTGAVKFKLKSKSITVYDQ